MHRTAREFMQQNSNEKSVLLIAYKISVGEGSEPGAGWSSMLGHLICGSRVHLISTSKNITDLVLPDEFHSQADFTSIDLNRNVESFLKRFPFAEQITYFFWNLEVRRHLKIIMTHSKFNFVHQSTFAGDWNPSCILWNLGGSLFWGPIGGTQKVPFGAYKWLGIKSISMEILRLIVTSPLRRLNRYLAKKYDVHVLVANDTTAKFFAKDCKVSRANQIVIEHVKHGPDQFENQLEKFLLGSGRLIGWKMWPIAIKAIAKINSPKSHLIIFGKGPEEIRLNRLIKKMKAVGIIQIKSLIPRTELLSLLQKTQVYVFPSLKDSSPWSLAEALHMGIPIAAFNISGVSEMVPNADVNLASIKGDLESNLAKKILNPYQIAEKILFVTASYLLSIKIFFMLIKKKPSEESKILAVLDQAISSGMSLLVFFFIAIDYSLAQIAVFSLVSNISYSVATTLKSKFVYTSVITLQKRDSVSQLDNFKLGISKLPVPSTSIIAILIFGISIIKLGQFAFSMTMTILFMGILLTDFYRNSLIHQKHRYTSFKLNLLSLILLCIYFYGSYAFPNFKVDVLIFWCSLQYIFPFYIWCQILKKNAVYAEQLMEEVLLGKYFFWDSVILRVASISGSLAVLLFDGNLAGAMSIAYMIFAALPSFMGSALQPISNLFSSRATDKQKFNSVITTVYLSHIVWFLVLYIFFTFKISWISPNFYLSQIWGPAMILMSMATAFLNIYQIRMFLDLGKSFSLKIRVMSSLFMGPIAALVVILSTVEVYTVYSLVTLCILNPFVYRKIHFSRFFSNTNCSKKN